MARSRKKFAYESPLPDEELSWRMGSSAGRKLEGRLRSAGWDVDDPDTESALGET